MQGTTNFQGWVLIIARHWVPTPMPMPITAHPHGFWVGMGVILLFMGGHGCDIIGHGFHFIMGGHGFDNERPFICPIQPRLGVGG